VPPRRTCNRTQIKPIAAVVAFVDLGYGTARNGGSRSYARSRLVTLDERLPGSFPLQYKIQKRSLRSPAP